jgi:multisubunit Na+/H+ antiporter MnhC subunit
MAAAPSAAVREPEEKKSSPSGRLLLRMPAELHAALARAAERDGVSLNQFITSSLSRRIGWGDAAADAPGADEAAERRARVVVAALVANAIVIGLAAVAAIAILILAWRG